MTDMARKNDSEKYWFRAPKHNASLGSDSELLPRSISSLNIDYAGLSISVVGKIR